VGFELGQAVRLVQVAESERDAAHLGVQPAAVIDEQLAKVDDLEIRELLGLIQERVVAASPVENSAAGGEQRAQLLDGSEKGAPSLNPRRGLLVVDDVRLTSAREASESAGRTGFVIALAAGVEQRHDRGVRGRAGQVREVCEQVDVDVGGGGRVGAQARQASDTKLGGGEQDGEGRSVLLGDFLGCGEGLRATDT